MIHPTCPTCDLCKSREFDDHNGKAAIIYYCQMRGDEAVPSFYYCANHTAKKPPIYDSYGPWRTVEVNGTKYVELKQAIDIVSQYHDCLHELGWQMDSRMVRERLRDLPQWNTIHNTLIEALQLTGGDDGEQ